MTGRPLRLRAEDDEDLGVVAAAMQDAIVRMGDISYEARERRFVVTANRFRWETAGKRGPYERVRSALSVESVLSVKSRKVRLGDGEATAVLLDVAFTPGEEPGGALAIRLAGGGEIVLTVECIDVTLTDVSAPWPTAYRPDHERA